ncbi:hypothetical protein ESOMN_v1c03650 [Williamsoniiplasma somnilux]|uniref:Uncharacterized protein n=1 Tax=Williamsoniiplasma somnilux TaxID=215578 RepID=A0A2K8NY84_9MOLU|nr:DUF896 domain-containing protein [Williamsoniiplasma somnilux]ATZ18747.1 hypothetical protein ESOMN_v1c03650 [Williamsoniiplasma somnilux]
MNISKMTIEEIVKEINNFFEISKKKELTKEEKNIRDELRKTYINSYKENLISNLKNIKVVDKNGKDITPSKIKKLKEENK